jgi:DMSO reductase anchor subunit
MHPAYSVIFFTTASGAGYGLWFLLGSHPLGRCARRARRQHRQPCDGRRLVTSVSCRPPSTSATRNVRGVRSANGAAPGSRGKAWRRSRPTCPRALLFLALILPGGGRGSQAALLALGAVLTVWCTGMIYASLRTVPEWHHGLGAGDLPGSRPRNGGGLAGNGYRRGVWRSVGILAVAQYPLPWRCLKWVYWRRIDGAAAPYTLAQAIGIPGAAAIRPLDPPHTQPNFVMREMGYAVARRHAMRLRRLGFGAGCRFPVAAVISARVAPGASLLIFIVAMLSAGLGSGSNAGSFSPRRGMCRCSTTAPSLAGRRHGAHDRCRGSMKPMIPARRSWVESANAPGCDFPIQNLPIRRVLRKGSGDSRMSAWPSVTSSST